MLKYVGGLDVLSYSTKTIKQKQALVLRSLVFPLGLVFAISNKINPVKPLQTFRGRNKDFLHCRLKPRAKRTG